MFKKNLKKFIKTIVFFVISVILLPLKYLIPKGKVVILQTYSPYIYCENTRYLYEYLSRKTNYEVYWVTDSLVLQHYLKSNGFKFISKKNILKYLFTALRAKIVIDSGDNYFNPFNLISRSVIKITTYHGNGPKTTATVKDVLKESLKEIYDINRFDYVNFPSIHSLRRAGKAIFRIPSSKLINLGYPRCDQFFDSDYVKMRYEKKELTNYLLNGEFRRSSKILLYTPTWRPYSYDFPLSNMEGLDLKKFNEFLTKEDFYFFYTTHTANLPLKILQDIERIRFIDHKKFPFFDINSFMLEIDILLNDYSTTSTDFAILGKPQIFFLPDFDYYEASKGFIDDYRATMPGEEIHNYEEMKRSILNYMRQPENYKKLFAPKIKMLLDRYYDIANSNSCELFAKFIQNKI